MPPSTCQACHSDNVPLWKQEENDTPLQIYRFIPRPMKGLKHRGKEESSHHWASLYRSLGSKPLIQEQLIPHHSPKKAKIPSGCSVLINVLWTRAASPTSAFFFFSSSPILDASIFHPLLESSNHPKGKGSVQIPVATWEFLPFSWLSSPSETPWEGADINQIFIKGQVFTVYYLISFSSWGEEGTTLFKMKIERVLRKDNALILLQLEVV